MSLIYATLDIQLRGCIFQFVLQVMQQSSPKSNFWKTDDLFFEKCSSCIHAFTNNIAHLFHIYFNLIVATTTACSRTSPPKVHTSWWWSSKEGSAQSYISQVGFPTGRDIATFRDSGTGKTFLSLDKGTTGQKFLHCPGTKGQRDKLKFLPRDGTGRDS